MSRWWPERALIRVGASAVPRLALSRTEARIDAMVEAFERALNDLDLPARSRITVVLGGETVRYRIVQPCDARLSGIEAAAEAAFRGQASDAARHWTVRVDAGTPGEPNLACAADAILLDRMEAVARSRRLRIESVQPSLIHAYNAHRRSLPADAWFAWLEHGWCTLVLITEHRPRHVRHAFHDRPALPALVARASFTLGVDGDRLPLCVARLHPATAGDPSIANGRVVLELPPLESAPSAVALAAAPRVAMERAA